MAKLVLRLVLLLSSLSSLSALNLLLHRRSFLAVRRTATVLASQQSLSDVSTITTTVNDNKNSMSRKQQVSAKGPTYEAEDLEFNIVRPSGLTLEGTLTVPSNEKREGPVVVFMHGTMSNRNHNFVPELATKLVKDHGIRSYRFDFRLGKTDAEPDHRYKFSGYKDDLDDMEVAMAQLKAAGYTPFCLFGHSRGANDALLYASTRIAADDDRACAETVFASLSALSISGEGSADAATAPATPTSDDVLLNPAKLAIVVAAPRFNMPNMLTTLFPPEKISLLPTDGQFPWSDELGTYVTQADADVVCKEMDMSKTLGAIPAGVPILLLHGTDDELIPVADAEAYQAARPSIEVTIVDGARHAFRGKKQLKLLLTKCSEWIGAEAKRLLV